MQRLPDSKPKYNYYMEWDSIAAIPIKSYEEWIKKQIVKNSRKKISYAQRKGVKVKIIDFDTFVGGYYYSAIPASEVIPNEWNYFAGVYDGEKIKVYLNEEQIEYPVQFASCAQPCQGLQRMLWNNSQ